MIDHQDAIQAIRKKVGKLVKTEREKAGLTVRELAEKAGIAHNHVVRVEAGKYNVSIDTLAKIGAALGVDLF